MTSAARLGNEEIRGQVVRLDYSKHEKKSFIDCTLVYAGGLPPTLIDCDFLDSNFVFEGAALNTAQFLGGIANSSGDGKTLILSVLGIT